MKVILLASAIALAAGVPAAAATNLIVNGDFTSGLTGWSTTETGLHFVDFLGFREGSVEVFDFLSQTFADVPGSALTVDFDLSAISGYQYVQFNGMTVPGSLVFNAPKMHYSFALGTATGSDTIAFAGRNDPAFNTLNHIVVTAGTVPEPASWALMVAGFGLVGAATRHCKAVVVRITS